MLLMNSCGVIARGKSPPYHHPAFAISHETSNGISLSATRLRRITPNTGRRRIKKSSIVCASSIDHNNNNVEDDDLSHDEISRYSRHLVLSTVGVSGQKSLKSSKVLVIGAGGLGSPALLYLAAAGIGTIGIVDGDVVDTSNLQRQIVHGTSTVGESKVQSATSRLLDVNPFVNVKGYEMEFTSESALEILDDEAWDVVLDGSDNFPTKYLISDACDLRGIPWVYSAILGFEGQVSTFNYPPSVGPSYRDLLPTPPNPGDIPSCAEGGVLGILPGTCGCLQATECIKVLLGHTDGLLSGRVLVYDALLMSFREISVQRDSKREKVKELIDYVGFCAGPKILSKEEKSCDGVENNGVRTMDEVEEDQSTTALDYHSISPHDALKKLSSGWSPYVLDVRLQTENDIVSLPFTDRVIPHRDVKPKYIPPDCDVLIYCKAGVRGKKACDKLIELGVDSHRLWNLEGGIMKWKRDVDPSMPKY